MVLLINDADTNEQYEEMEAETCIEVKDM